MLIASRLRDTNRAEYLLYMWQIEDLIRAYGGDMERLRAGYLSKFGVPDEQHREIDRWYAELIDMMRSEDVLEHGHLQICKNVIISLTDLHNQLLGSSKYPYYKSAYYKVLPYIVEIRSKGKKDVSELETCFEALYGVMMLRIQGKKISPETDAAMKDISTFLGMLSDYFQKDKKEPLEF